MSDRTEFIPLRIIKYKEKSLILTGFTPLGRKDFFLTSYLKNNKHKYPFIAYPLPLLEIIYFRKPHFSLPFIREIHLMHYSSHILQSPPTQLLLTFLSEVYYTFFNHVDERTYQYIRSTLLEIYDPPLLQPDWIFSHLIKLLELSGFGLQNWIDWNKVLSSSDTLIDTPIGKISVQHLKLLFNFMQSSQTIKPLSTLERLLLLEMIIHIFHSQIPANRKIQSLSQMELFFSALENNPTP